MPKTLPKEEMSASPQSNSIFFTILLSILSSLTVKTNSQKQNKIWFNSIWYIVCTHYKLTLNYDCVPQGWHCSFRKWLLWSHWGYFFIYFFGCPKWQNCIKCNLKTLNEWQWKVIISEEPFYISKKPFKCLILYRNSKWLIARATSVKLSFKQSRRGWEDDVIQVP